MSNKNMSFVNPYNFIPLRDRNKETLPEDERILSGVINYSVLTKTPLFIANTSTDKAFPDRVVFGDNDDKIDAGSILEKDKEKKIAEIKEEHKRYDFFSYNRLEEGSDTCYAPVIPGSEIRGMFRNQYEILTSSCLSNLDESVVLSKRTGQNFDAGLIKKVGKNKYELYKAEDCLWRTKGENNTEDEENWIGTDYYNYTNRKCYVQKSFKEGQKVSFVSISRGNRGKNLAQKVNDTCSGQKETGYIIKGEDGPKMSPKPGKFVPQKHCCHIFKPTKKLISENLDTKCLDLILKEYEKNSKEEKILYKEYRYEWNEFKEKGNVNEFFPVYFSEIEHSNRNKKIFLSPACKTREVYDANITDFIKGVNLKHCASKTELCPACSLFGTIAGNNSAVASRIRFSDLKLKDKIDDYCTCYDPIVTLKPLSSPKINNVEFYVKKPAADAIFWTFEYYVDKKHYLHPIDNPELNGRKFYWHDLSIDQLSSNAKVTKLNMTIRPVKKDIVFGGQLYFDRISEKELMRLIWMLNVGEKCAIEKKNYGYKLGAAKPFGLGSIAVSVDDVIIRNIDIKDNSIIYKTKKYDNESNPVNLFNKDIEVEYKIMNGFNSVPDELFVSYPVVDGQGNGEEGFKWFTENHVAFSKGIPTKSPNNRIQEAFNFYMKPLNPELIHIENDGFKENGECHNSSDDKKASGKVRFEINKVYKGTVSKYYDRSKGNFAFAILEEGANVRFYNAKANKNKGDIVKLKYCGKTKPNSDGKIYDKWELAE